MVSIEDAKRFLQDFDPELRLDQIGDEDILSDYFQILEDYSLMPRALSRVDSADPIKQIVPFNYGSGTISIGITHRRGERRQPHHKPLLADYGHIRRSYGDAVDGMALDCYLWNAESNSGYKIKQLTPSGDLDEHKYLFGFPDRTRAKEFYINAYGVDRFGGFEPIVLGELEKYRVDRLDEEFRLDGCCAACDAKSEVDAAVYDLPHTLVLELYGGDNTQVRQAIEQAISIEFPHPYRLTEFTVRPDRRRIIGQFVSQGLNYLFRYDGGVFAYGRQNSPNEENAVFDAIAPEEIQTANATSRSSGAVGEKALVPKITQRIANKKTDKILDFGAGKDAAHALALKERGFDVTAWEFGDNFNPALHDADALERQYDVVIVSNVLNVQASKSMLSDTIEQIYSAVKPNGYAIANFPQSPRKLDVASDFIEKMLRSYFRVDRIGGTPAAPVWQLTRVPSRSDSIDLAFFFEEARLDAAFPLLTEADRITGDWIDRVKSKLDSATSYAQFKDNILSLYDVLPDEELVDLLGSELVKQDLQGQIEAIEETDERE